MRKYNLFIILLLTICLFGCQSQTTVRTPVEKLSTKPAKVTKVTISAVGDCTIGTEPRFSYGTSFTKYYDKYGVNYFFSKVKSVFDADDCTIANLECVFTNRKKRMNKAFTYKGPPKYADILVKGGVDMVSVANNHCYDFGRKSFDDTLAALEKYKIKYAGHNYTTTYTVKGMKLGFVSVYQGQKPEQYLKDGIAALKKKGCNAIIAAVHAGTCHTYTQTARQKNICHKAVDLGADIVLGHHAHWIQGFEKYKGVYIAYSLGNFCYGGSRNPKDQDSMILQKTFTFTNGKLKKDNNIKIIPCAISSTTSRNNYQPIKLTGNRKKKCIAKINRLSKKYKVTFTDEGKFKS